MSEENLSVLDPVPEQVAMSAAIHIIEVVAAYKTVVTAGA